MEVYIFSKAWYFALVLPPPLHVQTKYDISERSLLFFFGPDSGLSASDYAGCNLVNKILSN
jgi:hypothetical protein